MEQTLSGGTGWNRRTDMANVSDWTLKSPISLLCCLLVGGSTTLDRETLVLVKNAVCV